MRVQVGDIGIHYIEAGDGPPLVLVMGLGADHTAWGLQIPAFAQRYRVIAFDNRGVGQTDQPDLPYSTRGMAEDAVGLMDALGIDRAHIAGASLGGMIAQEVALNHPDRVLTLQLHCTLARPDPYLLALGRTWRHLRVVLSREEFVRAIMLWLFSPATFAERPDVVEATVQAVLANPYPQSQAGFARQTEAVGGHDTLDRLDQIRCPTLITVGTEDTLVAPRFSEVLLDRIRDAEYVAFPGLAHGHFLEEPAGFNEVCVKFLQAHAGAR
jgi:pimeloyl-ACP methyl ester carboxylesterase